MMTGRHPHARYCVIGDPVAHSLSPVMQSAAFAALAIDATYEAVRVSSGETHIAIERLRAQEYDGFNVTTPLKEEVLRELDSLTGAAKTAGAVNTVKRDGDALVGRNTDGEGCVRALERLWRPAFDQLEVLLLGAGPASRAIALALSSRGASISCWARRPSQAARVGPPPSRLASLVISALPADAIVPESVFDVVDPRADVFDVNYASDRSPVPRHVGKRRSGGLPLLLEQGALAFEWWTGRRAPVTAMREALERAQGRAWRADQANNVR
jgi:shikimate dehydrogenase